MKDEMRKILFAIWIVFLILSSEVNAEDANISNLIPNGFATFEELKKWTETSAFGGGQLIKLRGKINIYYIADRMHTSGIPTSESIFYKKDKNLFTMVYYIPFKYVTRNYKSKNGDIVITEKTLNNELSKRVIHEDEL